MTKTQAIRLASQSVHLSPMGDQYMVIEPRSSDDLSGMTVTSQPMSYWKAKQARTERAAVLALTMLGRDEPDYDCMVAMQSGYTSVGAIVDYVMREEACASS